MELKKTYGLIGYPLSHSFSSGYFANKFLKEGITGCEYLNFPLESISEITDLIKDHSGLAGLNVTIPYKEQVIPYLDELSDEALEMQAVNTVKITHDKGKPYLKGYNTDVYGFERSLQFNDITNPKKALILGTGGASKAVEWVLKKKECIIIQASRKPSGNEGYISYEELNETTLEEFHLIVNTTPLGMYPDVSTFPPIPYPTAKTSCIFFDLVYNPPETEFMKKARLAGCKTINGLAMLEEQAEKAWEIWNE